MNLHDSFTFHLVQDRIREINKYAKVVPSVKGRVKVGGPASRLSILFNLLRAKTWIGILVCLSVLVLHFGLCLHLFIC